ncbi:MAG: (Na+)-NQR maturation NqrM [Halioglobus sp.]
MAMFLVSVLVMGLVIGGMAIGVMMGRGPLKGSCGGMGALGIDTACDICGGDPQRCDEETRDDEGDQASAQLFYSADK